MLPPERVEISLAKSENQPTLSLKTQKFDFLREEKPINRFLFVESGIF